MKRKKRMFKRVFLLLIIIAGIIFIGNISIRSNLFGRNVAEAINIIDTLNIIKDSNPINMALNKELKSVEEANAKIKVAEMIKDIQAKREMEERAKEVDRLIDKNGDKDKGKDKPSKQPDEINDDSKVAYLTFDDGPSIAVTPRILEILEEYDIKATFFIVGNMAEKYPEVLQRTYDKGHTIGNHSYSHNYGYIYKNTKNFIADISRADQVLKDILGDDFSTNILRFPGGSYGKNEAFLRAARDEGYDYFDWNSLNGDAEGVKLNKSRLIKRFKETAKNKKELIVLMHDTDAKTTTADSLREILDYLIEEGYRFDVLNNYYD